MPPIACRARQRRRAGAGVSKLCSTTQIDPSACCWLALLSNPQTRGHQTQWPGQRQQPQQPLRRALWAPHLLHGDVAQGLAAMLLLQLLHAVLQQARQATCWQGWGCEGDASALCCSCRVAAQGRLGLGWLQLEPWLIWALSKGGRGDVAGGRLRVLHSGRACGTLAAALEPVARVPSGPKPTCSAGILAARASFRLAVLRARRPAKRGGRGREPLTLGRPTQVAHAAPRSGAQMTPTCGAQGAVIGRRPAAQQRGQLLGGPPHRGAVCWPAPRERDLPSATKKMECG